MSSLNVKYKHDSLHYHLGTLLTSKRIVAHTVDITFAILDRKRIVAHTVDITFTILDRKHKESSDDDKYYTLVRYQYAWRNNK